jgi:2-succinyl-6-hydroxy-2,4-cyclohexadiene-1-carboxylate synthase
MGCGSDWEEVASLLAREHYCIAPDLPGHGQTPFDPGRHGTFEDYAGALSELLSALGWAYVDAIGYSMGGRLLLHVAISNPGVFNRVILESVNPGLESESARLKRRVADRMLAERLEQEPYDTFLDAWYAQALFGRLDRAAGYAGMIRRRKRNDPRTMAQVLRTAGVAEQAPLWNGLATLSSKALVVCGEHDIKYLDIATRVAGENERFRCAVMKGCSHAAHVEDPRGFADTCRSFLGEAPWERNA